MLWLKQVSIWRVTIIGIFGQRYEIFQLRLFVVNASVSRVGVRRKISWLKFQLWKSKMKFNIFMEVKLMNLLKLMKNEMFFRIGNLWMILKVWNSYFSLSKAIFRKQFKMFFKTIFFDQDYWEKKILSGEWRITAEENVSSLSIRCNHVWRKSRLYLCQLLSVKEICHGSKLVKNSFFVLSKRDSPQQRSCLMLS